jgi:hypothetical protein
MKAAKKTIWQIRIERKQGGRAENRSEQEQNRER